MRKPRRVSAYDLDPEKSARFAGMFSDRVVVASDLAAAARASDIIITCTTASRYFLTGDMIRPGTFIAAVGADFFYTSGLGPNSMIGGHVGGEIELNDLLEIAEHALDSSDLLVLVTLVPEPSTLTMLLAGILATFVHRCRAGG